MNGRIQRENPNTGLPFPRIGKLRIGKKELSRNGNEYPVSVDYFIPTGKYAGLFTKAYGEKPSTIQIVFPDNDPSKVCNEYYEYRNDKGELIAKGDGLVFSVWNAKVKAYQQFSVEDYPNIMQLIQDKNPTRLSQSVGDGWKVRLTLNFFVPTVHGVMGLWTFETNGTASTIPNVRNTFDSINEQRDKGVQGVIFDLNVQFAQSQKPNDRSRYPVVTLVPNESEENVNKIREAYKPINALEKK